MADKEPASRYSPTGDQASGYAKGQSGQYAAIEDQHGQYSATGFYPLDRWSKVLLGLITLFSVGIFVPVLINRELIIWGAPWLFYAYPTSILVLTVSWLVISYKLVE